MLPIFDLACLVGETLRALVGSYLAQQLVAKPAKIEVTCPAVSCPASPNITLVCPTIAVDEASFAAAILLILACAGSFLLGCLAGSNVCRTRTSPARGKGGTGVWRTSPRDQSGADDFIHG